METNYQSFEDLKTWQEAMSLCVDVYRGFAQCTDFGLSNQIRKSAVSVPSNIAEGYERGTDKEFVRFLYISKASCGELRTQLLIAISVSALDRETGEVLIDKARKISGMLQKLINARKKFIKT
jgi:four helix bundle protein